jgi:hypothetical protein
MRVVALLVAAAALGLGPADPPPGARSKLLAAGADRPATTTGAVAFSEESLYWPAAWLEGTPTRPNGFPSVDHLVSDDVVITPPEAFDEPAPPPEPPPIQLAASTPPPQGGDGVWAVAIGINDYPGTRHDLRAAAYDARDVDAVLGRFGVPPSQRLLLLDRQATADVIRSSLDWLVANAGPDATAVFYYAGHVRELSRTTEAIVAADGRLVTDADVAAHLAPLRAARTWLAFASCYGGGFDEALAPGRVLTAAADGDSLAYENHTYNRSYLGEYLVRRALLHGNADASIQDAFRWAAAQLQRDHPNRMPVMIDRAGVPVSLGSPAAAPAPYSPPPPPPPPPPQGGQAPPPSTTTTTEPPRRCVFRVGSVIDCPDD